MGTLAKVFQQLSGKSRLCLSGIAPSPGLVRTFARVTETPALLAVLTLAGDLPGPGRVASPGEARAAPQVNDLVVYTDELADGDVDVTDVQQAAAGWHVGCQKEHIQ